VAAEELGEVRLLGAKDMQDHGVCRAGHAVGAVLLRKADDEPQRVHARLHEEGDQAASGHAVGCNGHDRCGRIEVLQNGIHSADAAAARIGRRCCRRWIKCFPAHVRSFWWAGTS